MKTLTACIMFFSILPQSFFPKEGLLAGLFLSRISFCQCNHNSNNEKHRDEEDVYFKNQKLHTSFDLSVDSNRPNCHSASKGELHECKCKKKASEALSFQLNLNAYYLAISNSYSSRIKKVPLWIHISTKKKLSGGHFQKPIRPPKLRLSL